MVPNEKLVCQASFVAECPLAFVAWSCEIVEPSGSVEFFFLNNFSPLFSANKNQLYGRANPQRDVIERVRKRMTRDGNEAELFDHFR